MPLMVEILLLEVEKFNFILLFCHPVLDAGSSSIVSNTTVIDPASCARQHIFLVITVEGLDPVLLMLLVFSKYIYLFRM